MIEILTITIAILRILVSGMLAYVLCACELSLFETIIYACLLITSVMLAFAEVMEFKYSKRSDSNE